MISDKERFVGCVLGGAIGDAFGMPFERVESRSIKRTFNLPISVFHDPAPDAPCYEFGLRRGMYTDDTQACRATTRALIRADEVNLTAIADALEAWLLRDGLGQPPRYPGITTGRAIRQYAQSKDPTTSGFCSSACGAAIRIAPVALWLSARSSRNFKQRITDVAKITHTSQAAIDGALIVSSMIRQALSSSGMPPVEELFPIAESRTMARDLRKLQAAVNKKKSGDEFVSEIGGQTSAPQVVSLALFHLYKCGFSFWETLFTGVNTFHRSGIDMDSVLSIAGAIAGAVHPSQVLECPLLAELEDSEGLRTEAQSLYHAASRSPNET
jgi:ADP-ribosylglycohydrolase